MSEPAIHGRGVLGEEVRDTDRSLDTFDLNTSIYKVTYKSDEVTSLCPITGQPDWYTVTITTCGFKRGLESKSLKLYLQSFRDEGLFCEAFAHRVAVDVAEAVNAKFNGKEAFVRVEVEQKPRGGVSIVASSCVHVTPGGCLRATQ